jgi:hypothetical protein
LVKPTASHDTWIVDFPSRKAAARMHRSRKLTFTVLGTLFMLTFALAGPPTASAEENCRANSGEPTDPQRILDTIREGGFDLQALGVNVSTPIDILLNLLRSLGLVPPEESGS